MENVISKMENVKSKMRDVSLHMDCIRLLKTKEKFSNPDYVWWLTKLAKALEEKNKDNAGH